MLICIVLLAIAFIVAVYLWQREITSHSKTLDILEEQLDKAYLVIQNQGVMLVQKDQEYAALDQGMREQEDAYEQDFLTFREDISGLKDHLEMKDKLIAVLKMARAHHFDTCLPTFEEIIAFTAFSEDLYAETPIFDELVLAKSG